MEKSNFKQLVQYLSLSLFFAAILFIASAAQAGHSTSRISNAFPDWLEPRGISIVELVGQIPDSYLEDTIISYGTGIVVYDNGNRLGNRVTITSTIYPRVSYPSWLNGDPLTSFGCLGQTPRYDHIGSVVPQSYLRVYSGGQDRTNDIKYLYLSKMGTQQPTANSKAWYRYPLDKYGGWQPPPLPPIEIEGLTIPTNSGCKLQIPNYDYYPLTGVFTVEISPTVTTSVLGSQQFAFQSYIGIGNVGIFQPLMTQMRNRYPDRHDRLNLNPPAGANFILVNFPAMPGDAYTDNGGAQPYRNQDRPSSGTYRLGEIAMLSTDLVFSAAFPVSGYWQDADQSPTEFLPFFPSPPMLAPPEYVIPTGVPFSTCFTQGNCPTHVLEQIYNAQMTLDVIYLSVDPPSEGVDLVPLKLAGPIWSPTTKTPTIDKSLQPLPPTIPRHPQADFYVYLPLISKGLPSGLYGRFDQIGRMLGFEYVP